MSANLIVDLFSNADAPTSLQVQSGQAIAVGGICDLLGANTFTNVWVAGWGSGPIPIKIQTADDTNSGSFTDPTSGLAAFPVNVLSGGILWANSGLAVSGYSSPASPISGAPLFCSGGIALGAFQRPHRYARLIYDSGNATIAGVPVVAGFIGQKKVVGSGGGFTYSPGSGAVNV